MKTKEGTTGQNALRNGQYVLPFYDEVKKPRKEWTRQRLMTEAELFLIDYPHATMVRTARKQRQNRGGAVSKKHEASAVILGVIERRIRRNAELMLKDFERTLGIEEYHEAELAVRPGGKISVESIVASAKRLQHLSGMAIGDAIKHPEQETANQFEDPESARFESKRSKAGEGRTLASEVAYLSEMYTFALNGDFAGLVCYYEKDLATKEKKGVVAAKLLLEDAILAAAIGMARQRMKNKN